MTGLGLVSCLGQRLCDFWNALVSGKSGAVEVSLQNGISEGRRFACKIRNFDTAGIFSTGEERLFGKATQFAIVAAHQALLDACLCPELFGKKSRVAVIFGTTFGEAQIVEDATLYLLQNERVGKQRFKLRQYNPNSISVNVARKFAFSGPNIVVPTACAAGNYAISYGANLIRSNRVDAAIVGGADPFSRVAFSGFSRLGVMAPERCQPFDRNRRGILISEGAAVLVLEDFELARSRSARIYGEVLGYGLSCDASHMTIPGIPGVVRVMKSALEDAGITARDVDYVSAHGTGTPINDSTESKSLREIFYNKGNCVPVSSIKSMLGHAMGAASALEAIACLLTIEKGEIPPTINYETYDPECDIDCVPNVSRKQGVHIALNNSFAFGGNNASVVFGAVV